MHVDNRPLVHIGMPKCASTWLQKHFFRPRNGFREAVSTHYAYFGFIHEDSFQWTSRRDQIDLATPDDLVPVMSAEALAGNPLTGGHDGERNLSRIHSALPEARILIVIREQESMMRSLYKLLINFGYPYRIGTVLENKLAGNMPTFTLQYLYYHHIIAAYQQMFGADSVLVLPYEAFQVEPSVFLEQVRRFCEVDIEARPLKVDLHKRENINRSLVSIEIKRIYNRYIARTRFSVGGLVNPGQISGKGNFDPYVPQLLERCLERRFRQQVQKKTCGFYAESNAQTQRLTGLDLAAYGYQLP